MRPGWSAGVGRSVCVCVCVCEQVEDLAVQFPIVLLRYGVTGMQCILGKCRGQWGRRPCWILLQTSNSLTSYGNLPGTQRVGHQLTHTHTHKWTHTHTFGYTYKHTHFQIVNLVVSHKYIYIANNPLGEIYLHKATLNILEKTHSSTFWTCVERVPRFHTSSYIQITTKITTHTHRHTTLHYRPQTLIQFESTCTQPKIHTRGYAHKPLDTHTHRHTHTLTLPDYRPRGPVEQECS